MALDTTTDPVTRDTETARRAVVEWAAAGRGRGSVVLPSGDFADRARMVAALLCELESAGTVVDTVRVEIVEDGGTARLDWWPLRGAPR